MTTHRAVAAIAALFLAALVAACGSSNPNEHVQSNEFFRPAAAESGQQAAAAGDDQPEQGQQQAADRPDDGDDSQQSESSRQADGQGSAQQAAADEEPDQGEDRPAAPASEDAPLDTSDDIVRRYTNPSYGYSFELVCSPFCDPNSNGIDRVSFLSETGRALIGVDVHEDDGSDGEMFLRSTLALTDNVEFSSVEETSLVTGESAVRFNWDEDRRATGGFQVRWHALLVRVQDVAIIMRAGAVLDDYDGVSQSLERALASFLLPLEIAARPGRYDRFDFTIAYDTADVSQEFGQPTNSPPSAEAGIFVLQSATALKAVLTWQVLGEAFYDGDTAIQQSLRDSLGIENITGLRDWGPVDGQQARTGETETQFGEGVMKIQSFAWYCRDGGREFALHVLDPDDPESVALPLIESFRCTTASEDDAAEAGGDE
ncbi:MAG: hypothetical protein OXT70_02955 [Chloroflexota bacterium]|nr:hypothetical protein [Chloroflexota bacterium]